MRILVINGPNLNMLGKRDSKYYGSETLEDICIKVHVRATKLGVETDFVQSNHEGDIIDYLQKKSSKAHGIIINPGALTHYSYALRDALIDTCLPVVEVHLSDISKREKWRRHSVIADIAIKSIMGKRGLGYLEALESLVKYLNHSVVIPTKR